jgi:dihydrofolate reductase
VSVNNRDVFEFATAPRAGDYLEVIGSRSVYVDGGKTIQSFLQAGLIDELTLTTVPVLIGSGLPLFGALSDAGFNRVQRNTPRRSSRGVSFCGKYR